MSRPVSLRPQPLAGALLASALSVALWPSAAQAQQGEQVAEASPDRKDGTVENIVVTGHRFPNSNPNANPNAPFKVEKSADDKFTELLRDTPKTVVAVPKEVIQDLGATSFREVVRAQPGVTLGTGEGGNAFGDRIFIRGFEARNDVYIDGQRDPGVSSREIFAVEQIEIVKGPSSSFGGRGTTGGSVSLQSKRPSLTDFAVVEGGIGSENYYRGTLDVNQRIDDDLAVRVNGLFHDADTPGRDYVETQRYGVAASALWQPTADLEINGDYYFYRLDGIPDFGHPFDTRTQRPFDVDGDNFYGVIGRDFLRSGADIGTLAIRYQPQENLSLRSQTRYGRTYNRYVTSTPRAPCQRALTATLSCPTTGPVLPLDQWTVTVGSPQRNQVNSYWNTINDGTAKFSTYGISHTAVGGFEYSNEQASARRWAIPATVEDAAGNIIAAPGTFARNLLNPNPVLGYRIPVFVDTTPETVTGIESYSAYLLDTIKFTPQWQVLLGVRYDNYSIDQTRAAGTASNGNPVTALALANDVDFFNYQASVVYKPIEAATLYGSFSTSSNPSGEQLDGGGVNYNGLAVQTQNLRPERNLAYEVGGKLELMQGDMLVNAALFQITKDNARQQVAPNVFDLVGQLRSRGAEIGVSGNLTDRVELFGGYTFVDATIEKSPIAQNVGRPFANIPRHSFSLLATYRVFDDLSVGWQSYYQSQIHGGTEVAGNSTIPGYWRFDAVVRYRVAENAELRLNVLNVTDQRYYDAIYTSAAPFSFVAPGRSANINLTLQF